MQILVVYKKDTRELIAAFELNTIIREMNILVVPGVTYLMSFKRDIFYTAPNGTVYVREDVK